MADIIQIRRDTASNWTSANPVLAQAELGIETDTQKIKSGDGTTAWSSLSYLVDTGGYAAYGDATANFTGDLQKSGVSVPAYGDTTSNFTGALQKSGVPVAADANLNSFIAAVDLPVADGSADQVLKTDGSGTVSFGDAAAGGGATYDPTVGTETFCPTPVNEYGDLLGITHLKTQGSSYTYSGAVRGRDSSATCKAKGNQFNVFSTFRQTPASQSQSVYRGGLLNTTFTVVPSTGVITWYTTGNDWQEVWMTNTYNGSPNSTQTYNSIPGAGQVTMNGNIVWEGQASHQFTCLSWGTNADGSYSNRNYNSGSGAGLHGENGNRHALPAEANSAGYGFNVGYNQANSKASYRTVYFQGTTAAPSMNTLTMMPNTTSSTVAKVNMINQPGIYPSNTYNYPVDLVTYYVSGSWSMLGLSYNGAVSGEINSGFDRAQYSNKMAFLLMEGTTPCVMVYDSQWKPSKWTSYNSAPTDFGANTQTGTQYYPQYSPNYGGEAGFVATGVENEFICYHYSTSPQYMGTYVPPGLQKFKIDPATGKFTDMYYCDIDRSVKGWKQRATDSHFMHGLYGDDGNSATLTHLLVIRNDWVSERARWSAQVIGLPAATDWKPYVI